MTISIQTEDFELSVELATLRNSSTKIGALVSFVGLVRDFSGSEQVDQISLEHYPGMSEKEVGKIIVEAQARWNLLGVRVIHRVGILLPNDQIVLVATASEHRGDAFAANEFILDYLKTDAPFWKSEHTLQGREWLVTKDSDLRRKERWHNRERS